MSRCSPGVRGDTEVCIFEAAETKDAKHLKLLPIQKVGNMASAEVGLVAYAG